MQRIEGKKNGRGSRSRSRRFVLQRREKKTEFLNAGQTDATRPKKASRLRSPVCFSRQVRFIEILSIRLAPALRSLLLAPPYAIFRARDPARRGFCLSVRASPVLTRDLSAIYARAAGTRGNSRRDPKVRAIGSVRRDDVPMGTVSWIPLRLIFDHGSYPLLFNIPETRFLRELSTEDETIPSLIAAFLVSFQLVVLSSRLWIENRVYRISSS